MKTIRRGTPAFFCFVLATCSPAIDDTAIRRFLPAETESFARAFIDSLRSGSVESVVRQLVPPLDTMTTVRDSVVAMRGAFPDGQLRLTDVAHVRRTAFSAGQTHTELSYQARGDSGLCLIELYIVEEGNSRRISAARVNPLAAPLQVTNAFSLRSKGLAHYLVLAVLLGVVGFGVSAAILVVRTRQMPRRWLWAFVATIGVGKTMFNWTTGAVGSNLFSVQLLSASVTRVGILGPWLIALSFPVGALLALQRRRQFLLSRGRAIENVLETADGTEDPRTGPADPPSSPA